MKRLSGERWKREFSLFQRIRVRRLRKSAILFINSNPRIKSLLGYFEFSTNEKVAMEAGVGASFSGLKTLVAMKNFGLNVASDAFCLLFIPALREPTVIMVADDPSCHSSAQSEENSRAFAYLAHLPILEPSDPQECKDFTKLAFQISQKYQIPVMVRTTTRVSHQKMPVVIGKTSPISRFANWKIYKKSASDLSLCPRGFWK